MIGLPANTRVWMAAGHTDMRKGFNGLAALVQTALADNPYCGHVFVLRGRRGVAPRPWNACSRNVTQSCSRPGC